jgi:arylsulfatase A-like enzyme
MTTPEWESLNMDQTNRRGFLRTLGFSAATLGAAGSRRRRAHAAAKSKRPNLLFILTDDQREDTINALGNPHIQTPHLDELAHNGVVFTNAYCMGGFSAAVCAPSRMMTLRGRSWFSVRGLSKGFPNFPTSMNDGGYLTFHLGKRGNTDQEVQALFAESHYVRPRYKPNAPEKDADELVRREGIPGRQLADGAIAFLRGRDRGKPFFMHLAGPEPHDPRVATKCTWFAIRQ